MVRMNRGVDAALFAPGIGLTVDRARTEEAVTACLSALGRGVLPSDAERKRVDLKEEAGRRGRGGVVLPAKPQNTHAADSLADEVAAFANTPGGGALIVGVNDADGDLIGTELDIEWLRHRIYERVDVAPDIEERVERGIRLVVIYVAEAREPVEDTNGKLRWRVGAASVPVDRGQWWLHRQDRAGWDPMSSASSYSIDQVSNAAISVARMYLRRRVDIGDVAGELEGLRDRDLLTRIGVLNTSGMLTEAGALLFCPAAKSWLTWARVDVEGGEILGRSEDFTGLSLLEQIARVEQYIESTNNRVTIPGGFAEQVVRQLPMRSAREAVLNGVIHRDWHLQDPTTVTWVEAEASLTVVSPGGFSGGVTQDNALTHRYSRYPALADAARALGLVDKQGIGIDRMYRDMVTLGHRPPVIVEEAGPRVRARLVGGRPVVPVMRLTKSIEPVVRRRDVQVALIVYTLLRTPMTTAQDLISVLQRWNVSEVEEALETASQCVVAGEPLITVYKDVWLLSQKSREIVLQSAEDVQTLRRLGVLWYIGPDHVQRMKVVREWLAVHPHISSGDFAALTGMSLAGARRALDRLVDSHELERGVAAGRNANYTLSA